MKNTLKTLSRLAVCLMMIGAVACSDDEKPGGGGEGGGEGGGPSTPELTENISVEAYYKGDVYEQETGNYGINFVTKNMEYDTDEDTYIGPGFVLCVDFNSVLAANPDMASPQTGTYTIGEGAGYPAFSINSDSRNTFLREYDANGNVTETSFTAGTMEISYEDGIYTIECRMTTGTGGDYEFTYVGPISFINRTGEGGGPSTPELTENISAEAYYKGDVYEQETGNYWINFVTKDMEYDMDEDTYIGPGFVLCVDFNSVLAANPDMASPQTGTYTIGEGSDYPAFSINSDSWDTFLHKYDANGNVTETSFTAGTMEISYEDGIYTIECRMTTDTEEDYEFTYVGPISFINRTGEGEMSNLTGNVEVTGLTQGLVMYGGEAFTPTSDLYMVILAGEDYDLDFNYGQADAIQISFNVTPGEDTGIPSGTYTVVDPVTADDYPVGTFLGGLYSMEYGGYFGTWYFSTENHLEAAMKDGTVVVTNEGLDFYRFDITLEDGYGHQVKASFSGKTLFADAS